MGDPVRTPLPNRALETPQKRLSHRAGRRESGLTVRALLLGLIFTGVCDLWIHWAELILSGRGHTALANTSIPIGAFNILFTLAVINLLLKRFLRPLAFSSAELLVIYVMMTVSTVISSSGGIPKRSNDRRRASVRRSADGDGIKPCCSSSS